MNKILFFSFKSIPLILLSLFVILGVLVCNFVQITELDTKIIIFLQNSLSDINLDVFKFLSKFHNRYVNVIMFFVIFFLVYKKDYGLAFMSFISEYTRNDVILFIKDIFQRHRPPIELQPYSHPQDYSFPSGHSYNIYTRRNFNLYNIKVCKKQNNQIYTIFSLHCHSYFCGIIKTNARSTLPDRCSCRISARCNSSNNYLDNQYKI